MSRSEFDLIYNCLAASGAVFDSDEVVCGIGDDAAQLRLAKDAVLNVSMDLLVEGVHFPVDSEPAAIAYRALAVNLSDLAAMGARPIAFTLGLSLPDNDENWLRLFGEGLTDLAKRYACPLIGGDVTRGPLSIAIQVHGSTTGPGLRRSTAQIGDQILVSGSLGDGVAALSSFALPSHLDRQLRFNPERLDDADRDYLYDAFFKPEPRIGLGLNCAGLVNAAIDISDGLLGDVGHICKASQLGACIELGSLPVSSALDTLLGADDAQLAALLGGDDYELCLTAPEQNVQELQKIAEQHNTRLTRVGQIEADNGAEGGVRCVTASGEAVEMTLAAFEHFNRH